MPDIRVPNSERCLRVLQQTPGILRNFLSLATPEQLDWQPSSERWSIGMVLAHLAEVEIAGFRNRFAAMLGAHRPLLPGYDQLCAIRVRTRNAIPMRRWRVLKRNAAKRWRCCKACRRGRANDPGRHEELGTITIAQLVNEFAFHDLGHIRQVMELYRSLVFYPEMGVYQGILQDQPVRDYLNGQSPCGWIQRRWLRAAWGRRTAVRAATQVYRILVSASVKVPWPSAGATIIAFLSVAHFEDRILSHRMQEARQDSHLRMRRRTREGARSKPRACTESRVTPLSSGTGRPESGSCLRVLDTRVDVLD
jgi:hypothetical protein